MELIIVFVLILLNGVFAMSEIAMVSSRKSALEYKAKKGSKGAKTALKLLEEPEKFLSAVQVGITLVGIIAGAYGGVALAEDIEPFFIKISWLAKYSYELSFIIVVSFITYLSLVVGELVPKSIALSNPEGVSIFLAPLLKVLSVISYPVIGFLSFSTKIILSVIGVKKRQESPVSEDELKALIDQSARAGSIEKKEKELLNSIFRFADKKANSIMTIRQDIIWLDIDYSIEKIIDKVSKSNHSYYPVCKDNIDNVAGIVSAKALLSGVRKENFRLDEYLIPPLYIPQNVNALKILENFRENKKYIAIIIDEYGSVEGMLTLHDLIEDIFGDLPDIYEDNEPLIITREDGSLLADGSISIYDLADKLEIDVDALKESSYTTLGGLLMYKLKEIPRTGNSIIAEGYKMEVVDMDGRRIDKVLISKIENV